MTEFFNLFFGFMRNCLGLLDNVTLSIGGYTTSYLDIVFAFLATFIIISVFWKGARA